MSKDASLFPRLSPQPPDALLQLIGEFRTDPRTEKIDLGVGVFRDADGATPVLASIKAAERNLWEQQSSKAYLGPEGNVAFGDVLKALVFGNADDRLVAVQTPGGTGALRLAMDLIAQARPQSRIFVAIPTWPNHFSLAKAARTEMVKVAGFDTNSQTLAFDAFCTALDEAHPGDAVLLHGCCHNPTGADFTSAEWDKIAEIVSRRRLLPLIDLAYQGLGKGFEDDAAGMKKVLNACDEALVAYSCDKNFALYRERVGALFLKAADARTAAIAFSNLLALARANWSMPPDHGAAAVQLILEDPALTAQWRDELDAMRRRVVALRTQLASQHPLLHAIGSQHGFFSQLPVTPEMVVRLKREFGIYMAASGRINVAGFTEANIPIFVAALRRVAGE
jgi:aromatic-amino-acid transaminase